MIFECDAKAIPSWARIQPSVIYITISSGQHHLVTYCGVRLNVVLWVKRSQPQLVLLNNYGEMA